MKSFELGNGTVRLEITELGAHLGPVVFMTGSGGRIEPYYMSPWQEEEDYVSDPPVLGPLRGDFFCLPFGSGGEGYPPHGFISGQRWEKVSSTDQDGLSSITLRHSREGSDECVTGTWSIKEGHSCIYTSHVATGFNRRLPVGHHAILSADRGELELSSSPYRYGITHTPADPYTADREYYSIASGSRFTDLSAVPTVWSAQDTEDCSLFPSREGFVNIIQTIDTPNETIGWHTACCQEAGYLWFSLKRIEQLPTTVYWREDHGRHGYPWNGRNRCIGIEDVCSLLADPVEASIDPANTLESDGCPTAYSFAFDTPADFRYIQGAVSIPEGFDRVADMTFEEDGKGIVCLSTSGIEVRIDCSWDYLTGNEL